MASARSLSTVTFTATTTQPNADEARAASALRGELREQMARHWQFPDWSTLEVTGPMKVVGASGRVWYRWKATVTSKAVVDRTS